MPTPKTNLFSPCLLQFVRWSILLSWWVFRQPLANTLFSENIISAYSWYSKLKWLQSQKHVLLGFFLLSVTVCVMKPWKFMARQSYFHVKSSSLTSSIFKTALWQVSSPLGLNSRLLLPVLTVQLQTRGEGGGCFNCHWKIPLHALLHHLCSRFTKVLNLASVHPPEGLSHDLMAFPKASQARYVCWFS